jgi:uncharacterized protein with NAD-binding domain and iron-sulfur cluster
MGHEKKKIAVLGGGTGSLAAVWALTSVDGWDEDYEITVYQMGWRLGGKGASGRNPDRHQRIEEHGLHVWAGFYENAFRVMREVYDELDRPPEAPLSDWREAFVEHSDVVLEEFVDGHWESWSVHFPTNDEIPGDGGVMPEPWDYVQMALQWLLGMVRNSPVLERIGAAADEPTSLWEALTGGDDHPEITPETPRGRGLPDDLSGFSVEGLVDAARRFGHWLQRDARDHFLDDHRAIVALVGTALDRLVEEFADELDDYPDARRLYHILDLGLAAIKGMLFGGVLFGGFDRLDIWNWRDWLRHWGVSESTLNSVLVRGIHDYVFGYLDGDTSEPRLAAGTAMHGIFRLIFTYKGALFYEMQGGMGDVVFAPMYEALRARGVNFEFFCRVDNLGVGDDGDAIDRIEMTRQATVVGGGTYEPLFDVEGLPCWPSHPLYDQLEEGDELRDRGINLESSWSPWEGVETLELERGRDFDEVILGISIGAFDQIGAELKEAHEPFDRMVDAIGTVKTQAFQLWFDADAHRLGAPVPPVISTGYVDPTNTWADMTFLIEREDWGPDAPGFLAYFCGPMTDVRPRPPFDDHGFPEREHDRVRRDAIAWLSNNAGHIWTRSGTPTSPAGLDWSLLRGEGSGVERMDAQYFRANIDPTERYVQSLPGTTRLRLRAGESGFENLYLAGDWVYTSISAGSIESAVMAGLHAAEALGGHTFSIVDRAY